MPLVSVMTSAPSDDTRKEEILQDISRCTSEATGKPETYIMVCLESRQACMAGTTDPAAFVDIRAIGGLNKTVNADLSERLCNLLEEKLSVPTDRVYITFTDVAATHWGWDRRTFG